jgi:hypothetical protein
MLQLCPVELLAREPIRPSEHLAVGKCQDERNSVPSRDGLGDQSTECALADDRIELPQISHETLEPTVERGSGLERSVRTRRRGDRTRVDLDHAGLALDCSSASRQEATARASDHYVVAPLRE